MRDEKFESLKFDEDSPIPEDKRDAFTGLNYYPPDPSYKVNIRMIRLDNMDRVELATSDGKEREFVKYAWAEFNLNGKTHRLLILRPLPVIAKTKFFLAFTDRTSAEETYGAGRYIDLNFRPGQRNITIDFNQAYNPFCAYNPEYSCPLPPKENHLDIPIFAGEKNFEY